MNDLVRLTDVPGLWYVGNHGYELLSPDGRYGVLHSTEQP